MIDLLGWLVGLLVVLFIVNGVLAMYIKHLNKRIAWVEGRIKGGRDKKRFKNK